MLEILTRNWWAIALRGVVFIIFGILALVWPELTLLTLVFLFGACALLDGVFAIFAGIVSYGRNVRWWAMVLGGVTGIILGLLTFFWPDITAFTLLFIIAAWALITGIFEIVTTIQLRRVITDEWIMILYSIASILFVLLLVFFRGSGVLNLIWLIGSYSIFVGILLIALAFRLSSMKSKD